MEQGKRRRFSGIAYGGDVITDHGWWDRVVFDLDGLQTPAKMPALLEHEGSRSVGVIEEAVVADGKFSVAGDLFTGIDPDADAVAAKADAGMPWQMSVRIFPESIEEVRSGASVLVNGRTFAGPLHVFRRNRVREVSFCAVGADGSTSAQVFNGGAPSRIPLLTTEGASEMTTQTTGQDVAAITAERDAALAKLADLQGKFDELNAQFTARQKAEREAAVKELMGEAFNAESAKPFMDMTEAQFAAVKSMKPAGGLPASFTAEQATEGGAPNDIESSVLVQSARTMFGARKAV